MSETVQTSPENSISEQLRVALEQLSPDQIRFVVARQEYPTDKEAAESIGLKPDTVYHWKSRDKAPIDEAGALMAGDGLVVASHVRRKNLAKAMLVKVAGLDSDNEVTRQKSATEIIEWEMGRAAQPSVVSGPGGKAIEHKLSGTVGVQVYIPDNERGDRDSTTAGATGKVPGDSG